MSFLHKLLPWDSSKREGDHTPSFSASDVKAMHQAPAKLRALAGLPHPPLKVISLEKSAPLPPPPLVITGNQASPGEEDSQPFPPPRLTDKPAPKPPGYEIIMYHRGESARQFRI